MDCRYCNEATGHTRAAGCIIAVERAAAVNEVNEAAQPVVKQYQEFTLEYQLARDVLTLAAVAGMPDSYWWTDKRVVRACKVLGLTAEDGREWAEQENERE
jgi:hypothetical protein